MRFRRAKTHRTASRLVSSPAALLSLLLLLLTWPATSLLGAQVSLQQPDPPDSSIYTLHVYANLVQIPTLVLSPELLPLPPIPLNDFDIQLDSGPVFHPTNMRLEGDDPIDLAILFDVSSDAYYLQPAISQSIAAFVAQSLRPHDRVSIYAIDCSFIRTSNNMPAASGNSIAHDVETAVTYPHLHGTAENRPKCGKSISLWGALATIAQTLAHAPGRRVILAVSTGRDHKSVVKWSALRRYAASNSITIFGLYPAVEFEHKTVRTAGKTTYITTYKDYLGHLSNENPFNQLCALTGGMVFFTSPGRVPGDLKDFADLVRGRYILEFPLPNQRLPGSHSIDVTIARTDALVRTAGTSYVVPDASLLSDPTTVPSAPSPATFGDRRIFNPPH